MYIYIYIYIDNDNDVYVFHPRWPKTDSEHVRNYNKKAKVRKLKKEMCLLVWAFFDCVCMRTLVLLFVC